MNAQEILTEIQKMAPVSLKDIDHGANTRIFADAGKVTFRPGGGGHSMELDKEGVRSLSSFAGFPVNMRDNLSPDTYGRMATELLRKKERYTVLTNNGRATGFVSPKRKVALAPERVLRSIEIAIPTTDAPVEYHRALIVPHNHTIELDIIGEQQKPVVQGDMVKAGALVRFSPIGTIDPEIQSFVVRLACTNGAESTEYLSHYSGGGGNGNSKDDNPWKWFKKSMRDAYNALDRIIENWRGLKSELVSPEERAAVLARLLQEAKLSQEARSAVHAKAHTEPPQDMYDMMNLITWASTHVLQRPSEIVRARRTAAEFAAASTHARICPSCGRSRNLVLPPTETPVQIAS